MTELQIGDEAPDFTLPTDGGGEVTLSDLKGQNVILYFYPKDDTPGCTQESCDFNENLHLFNAADTEIVGISKCSVTKHDKFKAKHGFKFPLASDENCDVCERYGVWKEKSMYGKKYMGIERSTFLVDMNGKIAGIWRKVKVAGHVEEALEASRSLPEAA